MNRIRLGCVGWERTEWSGRFYPADLPAEWRLTFYNTQFSCVWLPLADWQTIDVETARQWRRDTHAEFRFLLEKPDRFEADQRAALVELGDRLGACLARDDAACIWVRRGADLRVLADRLRTDTGGRYVLVEDGDLATLEQVATLIGLLGG